MRPTTRLKKSFIILERKKVPSSCNVKSSYINAISSLFSVECYREYGSEFQTKLLIRYINKVGDQLIPFTSLSGFYLTHGPSTNTKTVEFLLTPLS